MEAVEILGVDCAVADVASAAEAVVERAREHAGGYVCLCNVHLLMLAQREDHVRAALGGAWRAFADGSPVAWLQRRSGELGAERVAGTDLMRAVMDRGRSHDLRHLLFGSDLETLRLLRARLDAEYPGLTVAGTIAPPFATHRELADRFLGAIEEARPHVVWCGLGAPKQELWMSVTSARLPGSLFIGVGAAFDFVAGTKTRAPAAMQRLGLEWLHRLATEPARLGRRYLVSNSRFAFAVARQHLGARASR